MTLSNRLALVIRRVPVLIRFLYYIYRFIQPKYTAGVIGVVINEEGKVLLVEHVFHPRVPWGLPGGWIGHDEDPVETAKRELYEELGLVVTVEKLIIMRKEKYQHFDFAYLCRPTPDSVINKLSYELVSYAWFDHHDLPPITPFHHRAIMMAYETHVGQKESINL